MICYADFQDVTVIHLVPSPTLLAVVHSQKESYASVNLELKDVFAMSANPLTGTYKIIIERGVKVYFIYIHIFTFSFTTKRFVSQNEILKILNCRM